MFTLSNKNPDCHVFLNDILVELEFNTGALVSVINLQEGKTADYCHSILTASEQVLLLHWRAHQGAGDYIGHS